MRIARFLQTLQSVRHHAPTLPVCLSGSGCQFSCSVSSPASPRRPPPPARSSPSPATRQRSDLVSLITDRPKLGTYQMWHQGETWRKVARTCLKSIFSPEPRRRLMFWRLTIIHTDYCYWDMLTEYLLITLRILTTGKEDNKLIANVGNAHQTPAMVMMAVSSS